MQREQLIREDWKTEGSGLTTSDEAPGQRRAGTRRGLVSAFMHHYSYCLDMMYHGLPEGNSPVSQSLEA